MSYELFQMLMMIFEYLLVEKEMLVDEVWMEINVYWEWFKVRNKEIF